MVKTSVLPKLYIRRNKTKELSITSLFLLYYKMLETASMFTATHPRSGKKKNLQALEDSGCILYFTCKFLNSTRQFLSSIDCTGIDLDFKVSLQQNVERIQVRWACRLGNWSFNSATNPASRIIFGQPLTHFTTVMWWSAVMLKP
jgi:hypothetical protein